MDLVTIIYLGDVIQRVSTFLGVTGSLMVAALVFLPVLYFEGIFQPKIRTILIWLAGGLSLIFLAIIIPSKQTLYTIAAVKYGEQVLKTPEAKEVGEKVYKILNQKLDEVLKETK